MERWLASLLLLSACPRPAVPAPAAVKRAPVVDPCAADLSGLYVYANDPTWQYDGRDDGGTLELVVTRRFADAGPSDGGAASITLTRADGGTFAGEVRGLGGLKSGNLCAMTFPVQVKACTDGGLTLLSAADAVIAEGCQAPARPRNPAMLEHLLTRADAGGMRLQP